MPFGQKPEEMGIFTLQWDEFMHYMYLPIHIYGQTALPRRLSFAQSMILCALSEETKRGNWWRYIYLTARRGYATPGNPLNRPGWHADGFGTPDINYVWVDRYPTLFAVQKFVDISDDHIESLTQFEDQVDVSSAVTYLDNTLLRLDQNVIHAAPEIPAPGGLRSFLKISFSNDRYNLLGNSHNYELDYNWKMYSREDVRNDPASAGGDSYTAT